MGNVYIKTYGCQMNVYDSQKMADGLSDAGYLHVDSAEAADLIILNTCHIREKAAEKVYSELGRLRSLRQSRAQAGKETMIAVAGCVAQAEGEEIIKRAPSVDLVFGPQSYQNLPQLLERARKGQPVVQLQFDVSDKFARLRAMRPPARHNGPTAYLTVQEGCDKFCSFCVVPYTRGAEASRNSGDIIQEAQRLGENGVCEITLLGQNVNAYLGTAPHGGNKEPKDSQTHWDLARLLAALADIPQLSRLRYTTSHPRDMTRSLMEAHRDNNKLMPYLHLPVQAGSDKILKAMNRGHKAIDYIKLIDKIREFRCDIALSGDFIVGYPGEDEEDFQQTLNLVREVGYASAFSFKYSPRAGTPGAGSLDQIAEPVKQERLARLQEILNAQQEAFNRQTLERTVDVLIEKPGREAGQIIGKTPHMQTVLMEGAPDLIGQTRQVVITGMKRQFLRGRIVTNTQNAA